MLYTEDEASPSLLPTSFSPYIAYAAILPPTIASPRDPRRFSSFYHGISATAIRRPVARRHAACEAAKIGREADNRGYHIRACHAAFGSKPVASVRAASARICRTRR